MNVLYVDIIPFTPNTNKLWRLNTSDVFMFILTRVSTEAGSHVDKYHHHPEPRINISSVNLLKCSKIHKENKLLQKTF